MLKDIPKLKVEDIGFAVVPRSEQNEANEASDAQSPQQTIELWDVYLINNKPVALEGIIVNSQGYGIDDDQLQRTSNFRFFWEEMAAHSAILVEAISSEVFHLANQYWLSFRCDGRMYDRKYIFVEGSISEKYFTNIPVLDQQGVLIM